LKKIQHNSSLNFNSPLRIDGNSGAFETSSNNGGGGPSSPKIVTEEKLKCYEKFKGVPAIIEGPEFSKDYSYFL
jgi:hypothetical protein